MLSTASVPSADAAFLNSMSPVLPVMYSPFSPHGSAHCNIATYCDINVYSCTLRIVHVCPNAVVCWVQVSYYDFNNPGQSTSPDQMVGHFINLIWKATTHLGCAWQQCDGTLFPQWPNPQVMVVCQYSSAADFFDQGVMRANVVPAVAATVDYIYAVL
jgi:Cysteine-rich secretory protein family